MSTQPQKKQSYKPRFEEKNKVTRKFNFVFDESQVNFKTEIPELPAKPKTKPNVQRFNEKYDELKQKISKLKDTRREKKQRLKKGTESFDLQIEKLSGHVELGEKCLIVLNYDLEAITKSLTEIEEKIQKKGRLLKNLQRGPRQVKQQKKPFEEMTYQELEAEQQFLSVRVSTANLSKKEQTQINSILSKLARIKLNAPHGQKPKDNTANIENTLESLERLKAVKESLTREQSQTKNKIQAIEEDIEQFREEIEEINEKKQGHQDNNLVNQCAAIKKQIGELREQAAKMEEDFQNKKTEYEYEQAKIEWINWATEIQKKKNQQWQATREERRRERLKEKNKDKPADGKEGQAAKVEEDGKPERKRINRHQKQIDACTFLISYCEGLIRKPEQQQKQPEKETANKNIEQALKTGEWSKMKDVQVVKSKKAALEDQQSTKPQKAKKKKTLKPKEGQQPTPQATPTAFTHQFFTLHTFDSVKVVPPTKAEEVEGILKDLNDKLAYYLEHPEGTFTNETRGGQKYTPKDKQQKYIEQKYTKAKTTKKVVNSQEFPSLQ